MTEFSRLPNQSNCSLHLQFLKLGFRRECKTADGNAQLSAEQRRKETPDKNELDGCAACILELLQCMKGAAYSDDVNIGKFRSQKFADFNTIHSGHFGVCDDNIVRVVPQQLNCLHSVICLIY